MNSCPTSGKYKAPGLGLVHEFRCNNDSKEYDIKNDRAINDGNPSGVIFSSEIPTGKTCQDQIGNGVTIKGKDKKTSITCSNGLLSINHIGTPGDLKDPNWNYTDLSHTV